MTSSPSKHKFMTLHQIDKKKTIAALLDLRTRYEGSDSSFAAKFDLHPSVFSQMKSGKGTDNLISDDKLVGIAMELGVSLIDAPEWKIANAVAFSEYTDLLKICQQEGASRIICDRADRGKTTAAKQYMLKNHNAFYVDCAENKTYTLFIKALCKSMGLPLTGTPYDRVQRIKRFLIAIKNPIVMLDEFGDLKYEAFLEMKNLWNGTECRCAWVVIGAQGLKKKLQSGMDNDRIGFSEFFRRFGTDFMTARYTENDAEERVFFLGEATKIVAANMPKMKVSELMAKSESTGTIYSLTRIKERIIKMKREAA